jgi:putative hydrolase of HD superfamily
VGKLKELKRTGWVNHNVNRPESVADHMYRMAMMSFLVDDSNVDKAKVMQIAVVHDLAEAIAGDIVPPEYSGISEQQKFNIEKGALQEILSHLHGSVVDQQLESLWYEYEHKATTEGRLVKEIDKLEMVIQAFEYEKAQKIKLDVFFTCTDGYFKNSQFAAIDKEIRRRRSLLWSEPEINNQFDVQTNANTSKMQSIEVHSTPKRRLRTNAGRSSNK